MPSRTTQITLIAKLEVALRDELDQLQAELKAGHRGPQVRELMRKARVRADALTVALDGIPKGDEAIRRVAASLVAELVIIERELARTQLH